MRRELACLLCVTTLACKTSFDFVPVTPAEARRASVDISTHRHGTFTDRAGRSHVVDDATSLYLRDPQRGSEDPVDKYAASCATAGAACPIDPHASYELGVYKSVPDGDAILGWTVVTALTGGLVAGNVACFGTDVCADGTKVVVGVADGLVIATGVVLVVALAVAFSHFRGD